MGEDSTLDCEARYAQWLPGGQRAYLLVVDSAIKLGGQELDKGCAAKVTDEERLTPGTLQVSGLVLSNLP